jgi:GTPase SAR1 family protein
MGKSGLYQTGFQPDRINLFSMEEREIKKIIFIGDGMSGKTQIILTLGRMIIDYLQKIYASNKFNKTKVEDIHFLERADALLDERSYKIDPNFIRWAEQYGFLVKYGKKTWDSAIGISLDTETIGFEDFQFTFPYIWNNNTLKIILSGADVGGQNIFDHLRNVLGKLAGSNDILSVIFDRSRALSCWNSINQVRNVLEDKAAISSNIPRVVYVGNKIDLEKHILLPKWSEGVRNSYFQYLEKVKNYGRGTYELPSLMQKSDAKERSISFKFKKGKVAFPDLEALIYKAIRESDIDYGHKIMSDVNAKALAREIAAQLVFNKKITQSRTEKGFLSAEEMFSILQNFGALLFQRRPLAMQFAGGIEYLQDEESSDSFGRIRVKWSNYDLDIADITPEIFQSALIDASNSQNLLADLKYFSTNAIAGTGVFDMMDSIIQDKLLIASKQESSNEDHKPIKRRIRRF